MRKCKKNVPAQKQRGGAGGGNAARLANARLSFDRRAVFRNHQLGGGG